MSGMGLAHIKLLTVIGGAYVVYYIERRSCAVIYHRLNPFVVGRVRLWYELDPCHGLSTSFGK
jgi:NADH:ubiquinone oxidoreductase subunit H